MILERTHSLVEEKP
jgi:hypothetical protein